MSELAVNPFDPAVIQCPYPSYARLRDEAPVHHVAALGMHLVTRHDLVDEVLRDHSTFSSEFGGVGMPLRSEDRDRLAATIAEGWPRVPTLLNVDPPKHTRFRRLVAKAFTPRAVAAWEPTIRTISAQLIDQWAALGPSPSVEFVTGFAVPLPVRVIARALNVPDDRLDDFKRWSDDSVAGVGTSLGIDARIAAERGVNELHHYLADALEQRRAHPQDDLLTSLLLAQVDDVADDADGVAVELADRRPLDIAEILSIVQQVLVAGNETTTKTLTEAMRLFGEDPERWQRLRRDPAAIPAAVEEVLRLSSPVQGMFRIVTRDTILGGTPLAKGSRLVVVFGAANRDERVFADPDVFELDRPDVSGHLAFGRGVHTCLGSSLARLELRVALEELTRRIPAYALADSNDFQYHPSFLLRGLTKLDLDLDLEFGA